MIFQGVIRFIKKIKPLLIFVLPSLIFLMLLSLGPLIYSLWLSFHHWTIATRHSPPFVGIDNFVRFFLDSRVSNSLLVSLRLVSLSVGVELILGFAMALLLSKEIKISQAKAVRTIIMVPMMIAPIAIGYVYRLLFHSMAGPVNHLLSLIGISPLNWLSDPKVALYSMAIADVWEWTPLMALILLAGLETLPESPYESAMIDGASEWQIFIHVTLPQMSFVILTACVIRIMDAFRLFDKIYIMTEGGPGYTTETITLYTYKVGFKFFDMGYAAALSYLVLLITILTCQFLFKLLRRNE